MRFLIGACALVASIGLSHGQVAAGRGTASGNGDGATGRVNVRASTQPIVRLGSRSLCSWTWLTKGQLIGIADQPSELSADEQRANAVTDVDGVDHRVYLVACPDGSNLRLVNPNRPPNFEDPIRAFADELIELPVPDVNPPVDGSGYVNLGMWLAVAEAAYDPISASAGPAAWMTVVPTAGSTTFDFGNGDSRSCEVFGVPIVDLDTVAEGPCGYTYGAPGSYTVTATTTWLLPYTSSFGSGALEPLDRTTTFGYEVREIQTVGVGD